MKDILYSLKRDYDLLTEENDFLKREIETFHLEVTNYEKRIKRLDKENKELNIGNKRYKTIIKENLAVDVLLHLENSNSIKKTAEYFNYDPVHLFKDILTWDINNEDILSKAYDYKDFIYKKNRTRGESIDSIQSIQSCSSIDDK